jgi:hypothetical protein
MALTPDQLRERIKTESQTSLKQRLVNCRANSKYAEFVPILRNELDARFPGWDRPVSRRGGSRTTVAHFRGIKKHFSTARAGYIWLVEQFAQHNPALFTDVRWDTTGYVAVGLRRGPKGAARNYFARSPQKLFLQTPSLADDSNNFHRIGNGWYVNLNLNTRENFEILSRFAAISKFTHIGDWDWEVLDPTEDLSEARARNARAIEALRELDAMLVQAPRSGA